MTIKHIVIGGGGTTGFMSLGALKCMEETDFWKIENIKSIYGTSIGSVIAIAIALKYDWNTLLTYYIRRPWNKLYAHNKSDIVMNLYNQKGIFASKIFEETLRPLIEGKGLKNEVTMKEFYEYSGIELHFFSLELNTMTKIDISHKTHPGLKLTEAVYMSSACPILFVPHIVDRCCYVDGGLMCNYPVNECLEGQMCDPEEVLGMRNMFEHYIDPVNSGTSVFDFFTTIYKQVTMYALNEQAYKPIPNEVVCITDNTGTDFMRWIEALKPELIESLINKGEVYAKLFMKYKGYAIFNRSAKKTVAAAAAAAAAAASIIRESNTSGETYEIEVDADNAANR